MPTTYTKETKPSPATAFTKELKPGAGHLYYLMWSEMVMAWSAANFTWDNATGLAPSTPYTKEVKP